MPPDELIRLALLFAGGGSAGKGRQAANHVAHVAVATLAAVCCGVAALACALAALWLYLLPRLDPTGATLVVAGVLCSLCLALLAFVRYGLRPDPPANQGIAPALLIAETTRLINENKAAVLLAALLAGLVAGRRDK